MTYVVLIAWVVQAAVGVSLFVSWLRHGRHAAGTVALHVTSGVVGLACWLAFLFTDVVWWAWGAFVVLTIGNTFGDVLLRARSRGSAPSQGFWRDYGTAIADTFRGRLPRRVVFHALFAGVVYFTCLGVCIGASIAAG